MHSNRTVAVLVLIALTLCAGGCYRHVVRAEGAPPGRYEIYEPNLTDDTSAPPRVIDKTTTTPLKPSKNAPTQSTRTSP
jgi:hypothetical protein